MGSGKIEVSRAEAVCIVRINDPSSRNAIGTGMAVEIRDILLEAELDCGAVVFTGSEKAFCSGANLGGVGGDGSSKGVIDAGRPLQDEINPLMMTIRELAIPIISSVRGAAAGVGASLALSADIIVASEDAYFLQAFSKVGLVPDGGAPWLLTRTAGRVRAMEMMLLAERLPAPKALEWGMINRVVPSDEADSVARAIAVQLARGPREALGMIRRTAWHAADNMFAEQLALERTLQKEAGRHPNFLEGARAFMEKRAPKFNQ